MKLFLKVDTKEFRLEKNNGDALLKTQHPVMLEFWDGTQENIPTVFKSNYSDVKREADTVVATCVIEGNGMGRLRLQDQFTIKEDGKIQLDRILRVEEAGNFKGVRLWWQAGLFPKEKPHFENLRYFAPPALFDKNDLDEDGVEDYFNTKNLIYREDRLNYPKFMYYSEKEKIALCLERAELPAYDSNSNRRRGESIFLQKTDIGSMGVWNDTDADVELRAAYPFWEGEATIALYISKFVPFGAFWPLEQGDELKVSYIFRATENESYNHACWESIRQIMQEHIIKPVDLPDSPEVLARYRLESLERYYVEKAVDEDENCPAGYVLNCHPQDGIQIENIIQYGFTGQNILNAYNIMRYGNNHGIPLYIEHARKIADFFANKIHVPESGIFYNLYNVDTKKVSFWWTGLLLPLAYAEGEELEKEMGSLYEHLKHIINKLANLEGAYLRCMNEDVTALLRLYRYEKERGNEHQNWWKAICSYCEFLLRVQEEDGSWYRAYDVTGKRIVDPEIWFGSNLYEKKSSTSTSIPLLVEMADITGDRKYLESAKKAGLFVKKYPIDRVRFNGGVHDSIYTKGQLIDNESILYPMFAMLALYKATGEDIFLDGAIDAARFCASWVCLWDVPLPPDSTLAKYGFRSTGIGACDTCGAGYTHPFQLMCVSEIAEIAILAKDRELFEAARLYWHGCNQNVSLPQNTWGYRYHGLQEEGYFVSWFAVDDPMFDDNTGFGHRWKGEGNKTCFPWVQAVALRGYWALLDHFGTTDFDKICNKHF